MRRILGRVSAVEVYVTRVSPNRSARLQILAGILLLWAVQFSPTAWGQADSRAQAQGLFRDAFDLMRENEIVASRRLFERALKLDPTDFKGWRFYGEVLALLNERAKAREALQRALALDPPEKDRAIIESRLDLLKPSILPGPGCSDLVRLVQPELVKSLALMTREWSSHEGEYRHGANNSFVKVRFQPCGDIYIVETVFAERQPPHTEVYLVGIPFPLVIEEQNSPGTGPIFRVLQKHNLTARFFEPDGVARWEATYARVDRAGIVLDFAPYRDCSRESGPPPETIPRRFASRYLAFQCAFYSSADAKSLERKIGGGWVRDVGITFITWQQYSGGARHEYRLEGFKVLE